MRLIFCLSAIAALCLALESPASCDPVSDHLNHKVATMTGTSPPIAPKLPGFSTVDALDAFYNLADDNTATDDEIANEYNSLARRGEARAIDPNTNVTLVASQIDPADSSYQLCRIANNGKWWVLCDALADITTGAPLAL